MGRLITEIRDNDAVWLFKDTYYSMDARGYRYNWPNPCFPYMLAIHADHAAKTKGLKVDIRRWIEQHLVETVIMQTVDKSYRHYWGTEAEDWKNYDRYYDVTNRWLTFHFEDEQSALAFKLRFADSVCEVTDYHPDYPEHENAATPYSDDKDIDEN